MMLDLHVYSGLKINSLGWTRLCITMLDAINRLLKLSAVDGLDNMLTVLTHAHCY